jgi:hypothetical protein
MPRPESHPSLAKIALRPCARGCASMLPGPRSARGWTQPLRPGAPPPGAALRLSPSMIAHSPRFEAESPPLRSRSRGSASPRLSGGVRAGLSLAMARAHGRAADSVGPKTANLTHCGGWVRRGMRTHRSAEPVKICVSIPGERVETSPRRFARLDARFQPGRSFAESRQALAMVRGSDTVAPRGLRLRADTAISPDSGSHSSTLCRARSHAGSRVQCGVQLGTLARRAFVKTHEAVHVRRPLHVLPPFLHSDVVLTTTDVSGTPPVSDSAHSASLLGSRAHPPASTTQYEIWS